MGAAEKCGKLVKACFENRWARSVLSPPLPKHAFLPPMSRRDRKMCGRSGNADLTWVGPLASLHASFYRTPILGILPSGKLAPEILCLIFHCAIRDVESKTHFPFSIAEQRPWRLVLVDYLSPPRYHSPHSLHELYVCRRSVVEGEGSR